MFQNLAFSEFGLQCAVDRSEVICNCFDLAFDHFVLRKSFLKAGLRLQGQFVLERRIHQRQLVCTIVNCPLD
jgi:hypothetical protein